MGTLKFLNDKRFWEALFYWFWLWIHGFPESEYTWWRSRCKMITKGIIK